MGDWMALNSGRRTFTVIAAGVAIASIAYAAVLHTLFFGEQAVTAIDDIGEAVAAALAAAACAWAASRTSGSNRLGWALMCISASAWAAGEIVWSVYEVGLGVEVPYPSLADAGFLAAVPFAVAGIRAFWSAPRGTSARWRVWFDGVIVALALISTAWAFGLRTVFQADEAWSTKALDLAYPLGDVLIGTILILAVRRATHQQQGRMALLLAGVASYSIADSAFSYLTATGTFGSVGSVLDTGWFAGYLMIALAAIYPEAPLKAAVKQAPLDVWQLALPWMTLLTASAGDVYSALSGNRDRELPRHLEAGVQVGARRDPAPEQADQGRGACRHAGGTATRGRHPPRGCAIGSAGRRNSGRGRRRSGGDAHRPSTGPAGVGRDVGARIYLLRPGASYPLQDSNSQPPAPSDPVSLDGD